MARLSVNKLWSVNAPLELRHFDPWSKCCALAEPGGTSSGETHPTALAVRVETPHCIVTAQTLGTEFIEGNMRRIVMLKENLFV